MADIKITGRKITVNDTLRAYVEERIGDVLENFGFKPMTCDVVLRHENRRARGGACVCEVTVRVRDTVVRVSESDYQMDTAIDMAATKLARQLRKFKERVIDHRQRGAGEQPTAAPVEELFGLIDAEEPLDDSLVREKFVPIKPLTVNQAMLECDLLGHDFYVFENAMDGQVNVVYRRSEGGYGIIRPQTEESDE